MVRASLLETGCHETKMTNQNFHNFSVPQARPGTASPGRSLDLGSAIWRVRCLGTSMLSIGTYAHGGTTP